MLTQEDFVAPTMSGQADLQRSSWKAEAIRRGDLKISGPIPITEDIPLNEEEEHEYAEKVKAEISPLPQDTVAEQDQPQQPQAPSHAPPPAPEDHDQNPNSVEERPQPREEKYEVQHKKSTSVPRETDETQRRSVEPITYSTPSPYPTRPDSSAKSTPRKKRKSGLRNVFRKMFGKKGRDESPEAEPGPAHRGHSHHASDPGMLRQSSGRKPPVRMPRISDLPVQDPKPVNPLGQHLPFPMNVNAPQEASPSHEYLTFERAPPDLGRRRATLPGALSGNTETRSLNEETRRLETWEEKQDNESIPSPGIGVALSTPYAPLATQSHSLQSKRRSRSAGALRDLAKSGPSVERRRSAEIRYWRHSHASASGYSTNTPRPRTAQTLETVHIAETGVKPSESITESHAAEVLPVPQHDQDISEIQLPVDAFNFGNLKSDFSDDGESGERTISHLQPRDEKRLSIEDRVKHLEVNMRTLESSVHRLSGRTNRQTIILENVPKGRRSSRNRSSSATSDRQSSHHSSRGSNSTLHLRRDEAEARGRAPNSPVLPPLSAVNEFPTSSSDTNRDTVIAIAQHQRLSTSQTDLGNQVTALYEALSHERSSRKTLEAQISSLQNELLDLHTLVHKLISTSSPHYPTPSPDAVLSSSEERMQTPRANKGMERERYPERIVLVTEDSGLRRQSWSASVSAASSREDVTSLEAWATPKEESGFGSGFFGASRSRENMI